VQVFCDSIIINQRGVGRGRSGVAAPCCCLQADSLTQLAWPQPVGPSVTRLGSAGSASCLRALMAPGLSQIGSPKLQRVITGPELLGTQRTARLPARSCGRSRAGREAVPGL
jgi:hypothetical protein